MTTERAIEILDKLTRGSIATLHHRSGIEALVMAIKALEDPDDLFGVIECQTKEEYDYLMNARWEYQHRNERPN